MGKNAPSHYQGRKIGLNSKHKGSGFKSKPGPRPAAGTLADPHHNSIAFKIHMGDKKLLKQLGLDRETANQKMRDYLKDVRMNDEHMSNWYRSCVVNKEWQDD